jgi:hypothetical protein
LDPSAATLAPKAAAEPTSVVQPPTSVPDFVRPRDSNTVVCAAYRDGSFAPEVLVDSAIPEGGGLPTSGVTPAGVSLADRVWLQPGKAALVMSLPSPDASDGPLYLVTDVGRRFAVKSEVLRSLGLSGPHLSKLPANLLVRIPEGNPLDPEAARAALRLENSEN